MNRTPWAKAAACAAILAGCGQTPPESVQDWITQQRAQVRTAVAPLAQPRPYIPQAYQAAPAADPFDSQKLTLALRRDASRGATSALARPELARPRQPLEAFPLDAMTMVGSLVKQGQPVALVRVDRLVHAVRPGAYLGQNYGKVVKITETQVLLREIVQDASGEWTERAASLQLQEENR